mmetsp:Transcript_18911/g.60245  ORF Transcript_18911/g.60245 Transcript_18911/m.60245 type:complete len:186 (+) Transcript_18911:71-628(+)
MSRPPSAIEVAAGTASAGTAGSAAAAAAALLAAPAQALDKAEFAKAVADKREAERVAALPASRLKTLRDSLANDAPALLEAGDWGKLRNAIVAARKSTGALVAETKRDLRPLTKALDAQLYSLDEFAYSQEAVMPGMFSGYCAQGVVPRDEPGACKVRPTADLKAQSAKLKEAVATFDKLLAEVK